MFNSSSDQRYPDTRSGATKTTSPVGWPVGEPPGGSMLTANCIEAASAAFCAALNARLDVAVAGSTPNETGLPPCGSAQSS
jgi:hypothetical protein